MSNFNSMIFDEQAVSIKLSLHHIGLLTPDMESSVKEYAALFGESNVSNIITVKSQGVMVCFVKISDENYIELIQPLSEESVVNKLLKKRITYYHLGYKVDDIVSTVNKLEQLNYKPSTYFYSEAFDNKRCIFLFSPEAHLIELIER